MTEAPPKPADEAARLAELRSLVLLDTEPEERFDRVTRLAQRLFSVDMALVNLIDEDRVWFKSRRGIVETESSRETSFCGHVILGDDILHVADATMDNRFWDNPAVQDDKGVRFYAGCPIAGPGGSKLGTLCVVDSKPRAFSDTDL